MKIAERTATWRRERRVLLRVSRAAWRLEQAERERSWALASARAEGVSIRTLAAAVGLSSSRVHQIVVAADLDALDGQLGELRAAGWPAPEDPDGDDDAELDGRELIADRLVDEVGWLRQCAGWLTRLHAGEFPPAVNLRPGGDHPERALVVVSTCRGWRRSWTASPPTSTSWPAPAGSTTSPPPRCCPAGAPNAAARGRAGPGFPGVLPPSEGLGILGTILGRLRGRAVPPRGTRHPSRLHRQPVPYRPPAGVTHSGAEAAAVLFPCGSSVGQQDVQQSGHFGGVHGVVLTDAPVRESVRRGARQAPGRA